MLFHSLGLAQRMFHSYALAIYIFLTCDNEGTDLIASAIARRVPFHYGWIVVFAGTLTVFSCLGLGRFGLGMLLPSMGADLGLSYTQMGTISTANFIGYLVSVVASPWMIKRFGESRTIVFGLFLVAASMAIISQGDGFLWVISFYTLTGFGSGAANVPMMVLVPQWYANKVRGRAAGFMVTGAGFAIIFSGLFIPAVNETLGTEGWRMGWATLGGLSGFAAVTAWALLRDRPASLGLRPLGEVVGEGGNGNGDQGDPAMSPQRVVVHLGLLYLMFGITYITYGTFIVTAMVEERGFSEMAAGQVWSWIGALSLLSGPLFGTLSDKLGRRTGLLAVFAVQTVAYILVALHLGTGSLYASIMLYGLAAWSIPSIMAAAVGDFVGPERAATVFSTITFFFAIGQTVGPAMAGALADATGTFDVSFAVIALLGIIAIFGTLGLPKRAKR